MIDAVINYREKRGLSCKLAVSKSSKPNKLFNSAYWVDKPRSSTFFFTAETLKESIKFQLSHTYFIFFAISSLIVATLLPTAGAAGQVRSGRWQVSLEPPGYTTKFKSIN